MRAYVIAWRADVGPIDVSVGDDGLYLQTRLQRTLIAVDDVGGLLVHIQKLQNLAVEDVDSRKGVGSVFGVAKVADASIGGEGYGTRAAPWYEQRRHIGLVLKMLCDQLTQIEIHEDIDIMDQEGLHFRKQPHAIAQTASLVQQFRFAGDAQIPAIGVLQSLAALEDALSLIVGIDDGFSDAKLIQIRGDQLQKGHPAKWYQCLGTSQCSRAQTSSLARRQNKTADVFLHVRFLPILA